MAWFDKLREKLNPAQENIRDTYGESQYSTAPQITHQQAYTELEIVNRGTNIVVDSASGIKVDIGDSLGSKVVDRTIRKKSLSILLNFLPNQYQTADVFKRNLYMDLILEGNAFIYFDGAALYNLPANQVEIIVDKTTFINSFKYNDVVFRPSEIIHVMENSSTSIFRGQSRLLSARSAINAINVLTAYHVDFFKNGAVPGVILSTPNNLSARNKTKILREWQARYSVTEGGKRPMIVDGDFTVGTLGTDNPKELDFKESIDNYESRILSALGVPPILLSSGNNANISQNSRQFYQMNILPLVERVTASFERFFGYDIKAVTQEISALQPDLKELGSYYTGLVNAGIMTRNEVRTILRLPSHDNAIADELFLPANIAGANQAGITDQANIGRPAQSDSQ